MGEDERGEFLYKWVSRDAYVEGGDTSTLLSEGQLHVAKFNDDLTGSWVALTPEATGMGAAHIAIFTRTAASAVGATTMDRPEWVAVNPTLHAEGPYAGTANVNVGNLFNSPDGLMIDTSGMVWIQTNGDDSNADEFTGMGNNQPLAGDPVTGEIRRFLTGPVGSEVTGLTWSLDRRSMFVGIQHPDAPFPDGEGSLNRSSIVAVKRVDNDLIG